jgi:P pilus assembly chaperone PapD
MPLNLLIRRSLLWHFQIFTVGTTRLLLPLAALLAVQVTNPRKSLLLAVLHVEQATNPKKNLPLAVLPAVQATNKNKRCDLRIKENFICCNTFGKTTCRKQTIFNR